MTTIIITDHMNTRKKATIIKDMIMDTNTIIIIPMPLKVETLM